MQPSERRREAGPPTACAAYPPVPIRLPPRPAQLNIKLTNGASRLRSQEDE